MLDILWMDQIFLFCVLVVVFLKVMDLVLVLVVAVVSRTVAEVREFEALGFADGVFGKGDGAGQVAVEELNDFLDGGFFVCLGDVGCGGVEETVGF